MKKTVFITGAAGGLGASATRYLMTIPLDVIDPASVEAARALVAVVHAALTTAHPQIAYSVKPDLQRAALNRLPECLVDPLLQLALRGLS